MTTTTMTQTHSLRRHFADTLAKLRAFSIAMYRAHGGWFA